MDSLELNSSVSSSKLALTGGKLPFYSAGLAADASVVSSLTQQDAAVIDITGFSGATPASATGTSLNDIIKKINDLLKSKVPEGVESLDPQQFTPDLTASRIVNPLESLFSKYLESNSDLDAGEAIKRFIAAAKKGVESGYADATDSLKAAGAFDVDGVKDGVETTKKLIDDKLSALETSLRKKYGVDVSEGVASNVKDAVLEQAGSQLSSVSQLNIAA